MYSALFWLAVSALAAVFAVLCAAPVSSAAAEAPPSDVQRDGERVWIDDVPGARGDGNGYVRGLETMLAHAGSPVDYDRLMGLSGMAFVTTADTQHRWEGKVDVGWWPLDPWPLRMRLGFLCQAIGCELREVGRITFTAEQFLAIRDRLPEHYAERLGPEIHQSIDRGHPVLVMCDFGFLVVGYEAASDRPPLLGRCATETTEKIERLTAWPAGVIVPGRRFEPMQRDAADLAALRYAVRLARDQGGPFDTAWRERRFTGQKAFAAWAAVLRDFDEPVEDRHHANMKHRLIGRRTSAVAYLEGIAERQGSEAASPLRQAADHYRKEIELLRQVDPRGLSTSNDARRDLADLIDRIAEQDRLAADQIERALRPLAVRRADGVVSIDVAGFHPGEYASSVHGSDARILQTLGESLSYDDLVCYGGFAFRVGVHEQMCPSAGHPCCGYVCMDNSSRAMPWSAKLYEHFPWGQERTAAAFAAFKAEVNAAIRDSIDRGIPVHYGSTEDGLIVGYADDGRRWLCRHPYFKGGADNFWFDEVKRVAHAGGDWPWGIVVWQQPRPANQRIPHRELTVAALKQAVDMWHSDDVHDKAYYSGDRAYAHWLGWLRDVEAGRVADPKAGMQGNGWCFDVLVHSRRIAAPWLRAKAEEFDDEARRHLRTAADRYDQLVAVCMAELTCPWDLTLDPGRAEKWTREKCQEQIQRLEAARSHDAAAIEAIEQALEAIR